MLEKPHFHIDCDILIFANSDLLSNLNIALIVHSQPLSDSVVLAHQPAVDNVSALSVEGDGVCLTCDMPKKSNCAH